MRFKLDENLPAELAAEIADVGHEAETVHGEGLAGASDGELLRRVRSERRVFVTMDKGIADIRRFPPSDHHGIVLLRPKTSGRNAVVSLVRLHLATLLRREIAGGLFILTERGIRVRSQAT